MNREDKTVAVDEIATQIGDSDAVFCIDYRGISVTEAGELRTSLRDAGASFRVVKNRLTLLAADRAGAEPLKEHLTGPTALTFVNGDVAVAAKALSTFSRRHDKLSFKGGMLAGGVLTADEIADIARLPAREVLDARLLGIVASPLTGLIRGLHQLLAGVASQLGQIRDQGLVGGTEQTSEPDEDSDEGGDAEPDTAAAQADDDGGDDAAEEETDGS